jgi:predicted metal-dependent phosphotriesterase family hydrolase
MRLISGYMTAFGINAEELRTMCVDNPERLLGISVLESVTSA